MYSSNLNMEAVHTSETSVNFQITRRNFAEYINLVTAVRIPNPRQSSYLSDMTVSPWQLYHTFPEMPSAETPVAVLSISERRMSCSCNRRNIAVYPFQDDVDIVAYRQFLGSDCETNNGTIFGARQQISISKKRRPLLGNGLNTFTRQPSFREDLSQESE